MEKKFFVKELINFFYQDESGATKKYSQYYIEKNCKTESSYNYENSKETKYCKKHKLQDMVNVKRGHKLCLECRESYKKSCQSPRCKYIIEKYETASKYMKKRIIKYLKENEIPHFSCKICQDIVKEDHFDSKEHIDKFNSVSQIEIKKFKDTCLIIEIIFIDDRYNFAYIDRYFKKHINDLTMKNINFDKYYKSYIIKKSMLQYYNRDRSDIYYLEKYNSKNILDDVDRIQKLEKNDDKMEPFLMKNDINKDYDYDVDQMFEDLDEINLKKIGESVYYINTVGCQIYITECELLKGGNYDFENIPRIFYDSKVIKIIKNKDNKCFIYNYIRKYSNDFKKHGEIISKLDKKIAQELEEKLNYNFDDVRIKDLIRIENLLETNIYVYTCNEKMLNRIPVYKSNKNYEKYLDLLLFNNHYMTIKKLIDSFIRKLRKKTWFCRNCCYTFYTEKKHSEHMLFCETNKTMIMMPSKKYLESKN